MTEELKAHSSENRPGVDKVLGNMSMPNTIDERNSRVTF